MAATAPSPEGPDKLIDLRAAVKQPVLRGLLTLFGSPLEHILSFQEINRIYTRVRLEYKKDPNFFAACSRVLNLQGTMPDGDLDRIPASGPLIIVANHPFGGLDAIALGHLLSRVRPDLKMMANFLLSRMPETRDTFIAVDPFGSGSAARQNIGPLKQSLKHLKNGGCLALFPAGEVSSFDWNDRRIQDPPWTLHVAALVRKTEAAVLPVFVDGHNSLLFQLSGMIHPRLRTILLARELSARRALPIRIFVGRPIPAAKLLKYTRDKDLVAYLRTATYFLRTRRHRKPLPKKSAARAGPEEILPPQPRGSLRADVAALEPENLLVQQGPFSVYVAAAWQIPRVLQEIGRLREITFRKVGEGTGRALDLEEFDQHYLHLFLWDESADAVVGAYRLGPTDELLPRFGPAGLYTATLFRFQSRFLNEISPALELGRSFIVKEHQKSYQPLLLLWRGIGEFVTRNPRYTRLFGPVSITSDYHPVSQKLMIRFLRQKLNDPRLSRMVRAQRPPRLPFGLFGLKQKEISSLMHDVEDVSALVSSLESDAKGVPVLLRHYLRLNGRLLCFNVDPAFNNALDGLVLIDLRTTNPKVLRRFMGEHGIEALHAHNTL